MKITKRIFNRVLCLFGRHSWRHYSFFNKYPPQQQEWFECLYCHKQETT